MKKFYGTDARRLLSVQMLAGLNIILGGDPEKPQNTMTEFLHNMSMKFWVNQMLKFYLNFTN